jgi:hypothetical protein
VSEPGSTTQEVEAVKRRIHQEIGEWFFDHWSQCASAIGGAIGGAFAVYAIFHSQVSDASRAAADAKDAATKTQVSVSNLQGSISNLATERELGAALLRIKTLEDWKCYAQQYKSKRPPGDCGPPPD